MSGIRRYTEELLGLLVRERDTQWLLYTDGEIVDDLALIRNENVTIYTVPGGRSARFLWPWFLTKWLYQHKPDVFWSPRHHLPVAAPKDTVLFLTIHDLVWMENRDTMPFSAYLSEWFLSRYSIARANYILPVSETTRARIKKHFKACRAHIMVISNGYRPPEFSHKPLSPGAIPDGGFFLAVGTHEPRKNYAALIPAYSAYVAAGGNKALLIAGGQGWGVDVRELIGSCSNIDNRVIILEDISDSELRWCYEHASALVSASLNEGFGIPLIEALYFGLPLIVSDIEPYREIAGLTALYFDPTDTQAIIRALINGDEPGEKTRQQCEESSYSWEKSAEQLCSLFQQAADSTKSI